MSEQVRIGGLTLEAAIVRELIEAHLAAPDLSGFPSYDALDTRSAPDEVSEPDLLAPTLLNVSVSIRTFAECRPHLEALGRRLVAVPVDVDLADADDDALDRVAACFEVLDGEVRPWGLDLTMLATVLHRKRPHLIPLWDRRVAYCYQAVDGAPLPPDPDRSHEAFVARLCGVLRDDLRDGQATWAWAGGLDDRLTPLRTLHIAAWSFGRDPR